MREDLHHVFFRVRGDGGRAALAVRRDVERLVVVEKFKNVGGGWCVDDGGRNELIHGFVVGGVGGVVNEAGAAGIHCAGNEGHADGALVRDTLEGADEVGALEVLKLMLVYAKGTASGTDLRFVSPLVFELVEDIDVAEGAENAAHETGLADRTLDRVEA